VCGRTRDSDHCRRGASDAESDAACSDLRGEGRGQGRGRLARPGGGGSCRGRGPRARGRARGPRGGPPVVGLEEGLEGEGLPVAHDGDGPEPLLGLAGDGAEDVGAGRGGEDAGAVARGGRDGEEARGLPGLAGQGLEAGAGEVDVEDAPLDEAGAGLEALEGEGGGAQDAGLPGAPGRAVLEALPLPGRPGEAPRHGAARPPGGVGQRPEEVGEEGGARGGGEGGGLELGLLVVAARQDELRERPVRRPQRHGRDVRVLPKGPGVGHRQRLGVERDAAVRADAEDPLVPALPRVLGHHIPAGAGDGRGPARRGPGPDSLLLGGARGAGRG